MPATLPNVTGDYSRVFLDAAGNAIGSISSDGRTVSKFNYDASGKLISIDQYSQTPAQTFAMPATLPIVTGDYSRVFLDATGNAIGSISSDCRTVSKFNYDASGKLISIDQYS